MAKSRKSKPKTEQSIRDRVKELRRIPASELRANTANWRLHPEGQRGAVSAMLESIGFAGALLARETDDGIEIIDGHLRADIAGDALVPVLITDLSEEEAGQVLATYDLLGGMAKADEIAFSDLVASVELPDHAEIRNLVAILEPEPDPPESKLDDEFKHEVPGMRLQPHEHYDFIMVLAATSHDWNTLCDRLGLKPERVGISRRVGTARAIRAEKLLELLPDPRSAK